MSSRAIGFRLFYLKLLGISGPAEKPDIPLPIWVEAEFI